ncbi:WD40/YVTN/BNR-like repeat-containing protein [Roseateles chitinivorans]|uniref:WD40/YVTN/BNR-like repeat-containing protein n=1 Tax=Roseateles chitinivorans TaxID=2917965 RepID=UPI003D66B030
MTWITGDEYSGSFDGFCIVDCAVRDRNIFAFALDAIFTDEEVDEEQRNGWDRSLRPKRLITFFRDKPEGARYGAREFEEWGPLRLGAMSAPKSQLLLFEQHGQQVYVVGSGEAGFEVPLNRDNPNLPPFGLVDRIKTFEGHAYLCGAYRSFGKRLGVDRYESYTDAIPEVPEDDPLYLRDGFADFDMFAEDDVYAAGGKGDVWHFNGKTWRQIHLSTNAWLNTVCCGGDGMVYISGYEGRTFMGRDDTWTQIQEGGIYLGWRDMVWFEDRAWAVSENGLWAIKDGKVEFQNHLLEPEIAVCSGNLYVNDGVMLMAGLGGACFRENGEWHSIFTKGCMDKMLLAEAK